MSLYVTDASVRLKTPLPNSTFSSFGTTSLTSSTFDVVGQTEVAASEFVKTDANLNTLKEQVRHVITGVRTTITDSTLIAQDVTPEISDIQLSNINTLDGSGKITATATLSDRIA